MVFYSSVAIIIGLMLVVLGIQGLLSKETSRKRYSAKKFTNLEKYIKITNSIMIIFGIPLIVCGILSFVIDKDLIFSIIFTVLIGLYFLFDFIAQKKFIIKEQN